MNRERPGDRVNSAAGAARAGVLDRAAVDPIVRGETPYDRAVREALVREGGPRRPGRGTARASGGGAAPRPPRLARVGGFPAAMIASVEGRVGAIAGDSLVLETGGLGYRVFAAPAVLSAAQPGATLKLHTYHLVREDQQALFGFRSPEELGFFTLLLTVTGVGPKVAMAIVGSRPAADLQLAILQQDQAVLVAIPGIGKKLADRIIFELKEKVAAAGVAASTAAVGAGGAGEGEVVGALQALGYSLGEAREASRLALADPAVGVGPRGAGQGGAADAPAGVAAHRRPPRHDAPGRRTHSPHG